MISCYRDLFFFGIYSDFLINSYAFWDKSHTILQCMHTYLQCGCAEILTQLNAYTHTHSVGAMDTDAVNKSLRNKSSRENKSR